MQLARRSSFLRRAEAAADRDLRDARSIRALSAVALVLIGTLALAAVASLLWTSHVTRRTTRDGFRATQGQVLADEALVALLTHRRLSDLWVITREPALDAGRDAAAAELWGMVRRLAANADDPGERAVLDIGRRQIVAYFGERSRLEAQTRDVATIVASVRPQLDHATESLTRLRDLHRRDVHDAYRQIDRASLLSDVVGGGLAALLLGALMSTLWAVRRWVVAPTLALHGAIERFRRGEMGARAPTSGARELCELASAYNAMADTIAAQREGQLTYLAGVAHDLRNPLGAMKMGIELIECHEGTDQARYTLALLDRQTDRMSRMVDDLLDATRIEAGRLEMKPEPTDLRERAREAVDLHGPSFPAHSIVVDATDEPVVVMADPVRIDQVLTNLLTNALKFSPGGGRVDVRVRRRGSEGVLEVQDRGIGMTREEMRDLFAPFRRRAPETAPGAGLGLSVVRRIVEAQGGRIEVDSEPKLGSTFRVVLPIARDSAEVRRDRAGDGDERAAGHPEPRPSAPASR